MSISPTVIKALVATGVVYIIDNKLLQDGDMMSSAYYAAASGAGIYLGTEFGGKLAEYMPSQIKGVTGLAERVSEISIGAGVAYGINHLIFKNDSYGTTMKRVAGVAAADVISQLIADYLAGQPLVLLG